MRACLLVHASFIGVGSETIIVNAMRRLERAVAVNNASCIQFRPKISSDTYSIKIQNGDGCSSYVRSGMLGIEWQKNIHDTFRLVNRPRPVSIIWSTCKIPDVSMTDELCMNFCILWAFSMNNHVLIEIHMFVSTHKISCQVSYFWILLVTSLIFIWRSRT